MGITLAQINLWLLAYKYWILFPLVVVEGPIISVVAGYLCSIHIMNVFIAYPVIVAGDVVGDIMYYYIGKYGKNGIIGRIFHMPSSMMDEASKIKDKFHKQGGRILLTAKALHGIGGAFLLAAGMAEMPLSTFIIYNIIGTAIKSAVLLAIGYFYGQAIASVSSTLKDLSAIMAFIGLLAVCFYIFYIRKKRKQ